MNWGKLTLALTLTLTLKSRLKRTWRRKRCYSTQLSVHFRSISFLRRSIVLTVCGRMRSYADSSGCSAGRGIRIRPRSRNNARMYLIVLSMHVVLHVLNCVVSAVARDANFLNPKCRTLYSMCSCMRPYHKPNNFKVLKDKSFLYLLGWFTVIMIGL